MKIVVVGAGQAGASLVAKLRSNGHQGEITMIGSEPELPYQRPPLSKKYLLGEMGKERLFLRPQNFYDDQSITLALGRTVGAVDRTAKTVTAGDRVYPYDHLVLTTGSSPRRLPKSIGGALAGVYTMRDLADANAMAPEFVAGRRVLIVGGGYIGLEAATSLGKMGKKVHVIEAADRLLARVASPQISMFFEALHRDHGTHLHTGVAVADIDAVGGAFAGVRLGDGSTLTADLLLVGIGVQPNMQLAETAGIACGNGILVGPDMQTSHPGIYAIGDVALATALALHLLESH
ncbi:MAG: NAD(P)/FAD-dependent oxidoreductase [Paracoccaceae bacterium]